jgi:MFS family permease
VEPNARLVTFNRLPMDALTGEIQTSMTASTSPTAVSPTAASPVRTSRVIRQVPFFYGWVILGAGTLGIVMMGPSQTYTMSIFLDHFVTDLGIGRGWVSLIYGGATLGASFLLPITGHLVDRFGTRRLIVVNALLFGLALMGLAWVSGPFSLLLGMLIVRFLGFGSMQLISNNVIAQWFVRRRGMVMGIAGQSLAISLLIYPALSNHLIEWLGWRQAWVALGTLPLLIMLPLGWLLFRDRPELYGLTPDGPGRDPEAAAAALRAETQWTLDDARHTAVFWLFTVAFTLITMITAGMIFHQTSLFQVRGLERGATVTAFQVTALFAVIGNLTTGYLLDRISPRHILATQLLLMSGMMVYVLTLHALRDLVIYAAVMGLITGSFRVMDATVWAQYFGRRYLGSIRGATMIGTVGGTALGAFPLGLSYDLTGNYAAALLPLAVLPLLVAVSTLWIKRPTPPQAD